MSEQNTPNIGVSLILIHSVITRGLEVTTEYSARFAQEGYPDGATREGFTTYVQAFVGTVHGHHLTEDEVAFPRFRQMMPDVPFDDLMAQHRQMAALLDEIKAALEGIAAGQGEALNDLNVAVTRMAQIWHPHIKVEETHFSVQEGARLFSVQEHIDMMQAFSEHSQQHSGPPPLAMPFLLYNLPPENRAIITAGMPPAVTQQLVPVEWAAQWAPMKPFLLD